MVADVNVALLENTQYESRFQLADKTQSIVWEDNGTATVKTVPFTYGRNLVVRVAKNVCK